MIRLANLSDAKDIIHIENTCFTSDIMSPRSIRYMLRNPQCKTLVYIQDNKVAAYMMTLHHKHRRFARHYSLAVLPEYRGQGIAEALMLYAESLCTGKEGIKSEMRIDNTPIQHLHTRLGYKITRQLKHFYEDNTDAYEMVKYL